MTFTCENEECPEFNIPREGSWQEWLCPWCECECEGKPTKEVGA